MSREWRVGVERGKGRGSGTSRGMGSVKLLRIGAQDWG